MYLPIIYGCALSYMTAVEKQKCVTAKGHKIVSRRNVQVDMNQKFRTFIVIFSRLQLEMGRAQDRQYSNQLIAFTYQKLLSDFFYCQ